MSDPVNIKHECAGVTMHQDSLWTWKSKGILDWPTFMPKCESPGTFLFLPCSYYRIFCHLHFVGDGCWKSADGSISGSHCSVFFVMHPTAQASCASPTPLDFTCDWVLTILCWPHPSNHPGRALLFWISLSQSSAQLWMSQIAPLNLSTSFSFQSSAIFTIYSVVGFFSVLLCLTSD